MAQTTVMATTRQGKIDTLTLDAVLSETHQFTAQVTEHPVEEGANIADHCRPQPERVTLSPIVSNTPFGSAMDPRRAASALNKLEELRASGAVFTIVTSLREYTSMALESVSVSRDARSAECLRFTASFKRIRLVRNRQTSMVTATDSRAKGKVKTGKQATKTPSEKLESRLSKGFDGYQEGGVLGALKAAF